VTAQLKLSLFLDGMNHRAWLLLKETLLEWAHHISEDGINEDVKQGWEDFQFLGHVQKPKYIRETETKEEHVMNSCRMVSSVNVGADKTFWLLFLLPFDFGVP
jgi:hypothetical protein